MECMRNDVPSESIPDELDPYEFFGIEPTSSINKCKMIFRDFITSSNIILKKTAALAYDMISYELNYDKRGKVYKVVNKDHFYYTTIGDLENLKILYEKDHKILREKDYLGRSLLYIAARNGYIDICQFLLEEGMDPNEIQSSGSTPLHGASFYNQYDTVRLLLEYGSKTDLKNFNGSSPLEDSKITINGKIEKASYKVQKRRYN